MARVNRLTSRVAAKNLQQHVRALNVADDVGAAADALVSRAWRAILAVLKKYHGPMAFVHAHRADHEIRQICVNLSAQLHQLFDSSLTAIAAQSHDRTAETLAEQLPLSVMQSQESLQEGFIGGLIQLAISPIRSLITRDLAAPLTNPNVSDEAKRRLAKELIFPPPPLDKVRSAVYRGDWFKRLSDMTKLAAPEDIAKVIRQGFVGGKSMRDIANDLLPVVDGVRSSARRIARNEVQRVAHQMQWDAWQEVKELIVGYQVHAVDNGHNPTSRPEHRARHLTIYYKNPKGGQKGMSECPHPPQEADGSTAHNCQCWLTVVFGPMPAIPADEAPHPIDPEIAAPWFAKASVRDKKAAVGADRYNLVRRALRDAPPPGRAERQPQWLDFVDEATGFFLDLASIGARFLGKIFRRG